ncbi:hypothetical protein [Streptomyces canus]
MARAAARETCASARADGALMADAYFLTGGTGALARGGRAVTSRSHEQAA